MSSTKGDVKKAPMFLLKSMSGQVILFDYKDITFFNDPGEVRRQRLFFAPIMILVAVLGLYLASVDEMWTFLLYLILLLFWCGVIVYYLVSHKVPVQIKYSEISHIEVTENGKSNIIEIFTTDRSRPYSIKTRTLDEDLSDFLKTGVW